jgi:hypothetical protein
MHARSAYFRRVYMLVAGNAVVNAVSIVHRHAHGKHQCERLSACVAGTSTLMLTPKGASSVPA